MNTTDNRTAEDIRASIAQLKAESAAYDARFLALSTPEGAAAYEASLIRMMSCSNQCQHLLAYIQPPKRHTTDAEQICSALGSMEGIATMSREFDFGLMAFGIIEEDPRLEEGFLDQWREGMKARN